jgi:hypothetical protein
MVTIECKIIEILKLKDTDRVLVKISVDNDRELMCTAYKFPLYQLECCKGQWVHLKIDLQTVFINAFGPQQYSNRFIIRSIVPRNQISQTPRMDW